MKKRSKKFRFESGSTTVEAVTAVMILALILFGMLQIYHWCMTKQFCQYAAFYASKSLSLGFQQEFAMRAARVAAIGIAGKSVGEGDDNEESAENYMVYGDGSGVQYEYWHPRTEENTPTISVYAGFAELGLQSAKVKMENAPILAPAIAKMFFITKPPSPEATVTTRDYANELLEERW